MGGERSTGADCESVRSEGSFGRMITTGPCSRSRRLAVLALLLACASAGCALPRWPVAGTLTSPYGLRLRGWRPDLHEGVDIAAPEGTPVRSATSGTVTFAGTQGGYGNVVYIQHGGTIAVYAHLSSIAVARGAHVKNGQVLGAVGHTGSATGSHLHLEVWRDGRSEDPVPLFGGPPPAATPR